jgi:DNA-binding SARP family transcriptional activator/tetratricopeptide (TPR) repeat protein
VVLTGCSTCYKGRLSLQFAILGPLEAVRDGTPVALQAMRERKLLAILLVHANEVVSTDRLVDELWGDDRPKTAIPALHNAVSRLRKALGDTVVQTQTPGYTLGVAAEELDAGRFEELVASAAGAPAGEAADRLREALGLWRGPALADFAYEPFAQSAIARLEELHIVAIEERIEADLALGHHDVLVGELGSLILDHPFRERLRRQLMVALYRAGRQADALDAYQAARRVLSDELGVEPSPALKELERAILQHDSSLAAAAETAPAAIVSAPPAQFGGERRRTVTVVLADIEPGHGGAELDPEAFRTAVSRCLGVLRGTLERYGATVERFTGDAIISIFGVPRAHEDDAMRAVRAAATAQSALEELNQELRADWDTEFDVCFGLATGEVIEGGSEGLVAGPAIALAKRLEKHAAPGEILIGEGTWRLVRDSVSAEPVPASDGEKSWRVLQIKDTRPFARHLESSLVGRKNELKQLRNAFERAVEAGSGQLVTVLGPAGIGKTRLALELGTEVASIATVVSGQCPPFGDGMTYWPLTEIVRQAGRSEAAANVAKLIAGAAGADELFVATRRMLEDLAKERPLVVVLEDLHSAQPTFLDLLDYLIEWLHDAPVLLLCVARLDLLEERPSWGGGKVNSTTLVLGPLSAEESNELLDALAGAAEVADGARTGLVEAADGNPLFVEQLATAFLLGESATLPPTLEALLAARLDRLGPGERAVVDAAAVAGREFSRPGIQELLPEAAESAERHLRGLVRKDLIRPLRGPLLGEEGFAFRHALVREAAYRTTPKARRSYLHQRFAARLKRRVPSFDDLIGYHLEQAWLLRAELGPIDEDDRSVAHEGGERLGAAGVLAWKRGDAPATVNLLGRSTSLLPHSTLRSELRCELGVGLRAGGNVEEAESVFADVIENAGNRRVELRAAIELAHLRLSVDSTSRADQLLDLADQAIPVFEAASDDRSLGRTWLLVGEIRGGSYCDNAAWEAAATRALRHYERSGWPIASCVQAITAALFYGPTPVDEGIGRCRAFVEEYPEGVGVSALLVMGGLEALRGRFDEARALVATARERYLELGQHVRAAEIVDAVEAGVDLVAGDARSAGAVLRSSCERLETMQAFGALATRAAQLAEALYQLGHDDEAEEWTRVSETHSGADDIGAQFSWRGVRAKLEARRGNTEAGETFAREGVALAERTDALNQHAKALLDLAEVLRTGGRTDEAASAAESALALYERKGNVPDAARARDVLTPLRGDDPGTTQKAPNGAFRAA